MNQHTPGPWKAEKIGVGDPQENRSRWMVVKGDKIVADCQHGKRDARLIAAAPELLEACKLAFQRLQPGDIRKDYSGHVAHVAMDKAIAKAEGRA